MDVETVWGVTWRSAGATEFFVVFLLFLVTGIAIFFLKNIQKLKDKKIHDQSLFLFKMKKTGFSTFQIKIINNIVETVHLKNPNLLFSNSIFFESAAVKFFQFLKETKEDRESLLSIARELVLIHDRLYGLGNFKKPLKSTLEIEAKHILYFISKNNEIFLGRVEENNDENMILQLLRSSRQLTSLNPNDNLKVYVTRMGDAEYVFDAKIIKLDNNKLFLNFVDKFEKETEFRHPYSEVFFPARITKTKIVYEEDMIEVKSSILKINDFELIARLKIEINYDLEYYVNFEMMDFTMKILTKIIGKKDMEEDGSIYYTFKFLEMSDAAMGILKKYLYDHR